MSNDKQDGNTPAQDPGVPNIEDLKGPSLIAKWASEDNHDKIMLRVENNFGPFVLVTFDAEGSAHFKVLGAETISPWMMGILGEHLMTISKFNRLKRLEDAHAHQQRGSGIVVPGLKFPPDLDAKLPS